MNKDIMEFRKELEKYKVQIDRLLKERLQLEKEKAIAVSPGNAKVLDLIIDFCTRGGKRIRPILLVKAYEAVGGKRHEEILRASICIELLEAYLLIHDDIIDRDPIRRGGPSFHKMIEKWVNEPHFGLSAAIVAGDMLGCLSLEVVMESNFSEKDRLQALQEFVGAELSCFHGELYDVILEREDASEDDFFRMVDLKTSSYTTVAPLVMGGILGGGTDRQIRGLREYGMLVGRAFQIVDDVLGTFGDEKATGKSVASDIKQGKKTLLLLHALQKADDRQRAILHDSTGKKDLTEDQIQEVRDIFVSTGALDYAKQQASGYVKKAKELLDTSSLKETEFFEELADYLIKRSF